MDQSVPVAVQFDQWIILGVWLVLGVICSIPASAIMGAKGQNAGSGFFLGFFLNILGIGLAIVCPASPERQAQAIARALQAAPQPPGSLPPVPGPIETRPAPARRTGRRRQIDDPTNKFLETQPEQETQPAADQEAAERSQGIADLIRRSQAEE